MGDRLRPKPPPHTSKCGALGHSSSSSGDRGVRLVVGRQLHWHGVEAPEPGDYAGVDGFLAMIGGIFERTGGDVKIQQQSCLSDDEWATEWEHAVFGRNGSTLEAQNAFNYRFRDGRIAEMWMVCTTPAMAASFWD